MSEDERAGRQADVKKEVIGKYLSSPEGLKYLSATYDLGWREIGHGEGNFKEVYLPQLSPLKELGVVKRENKKRQFQHLENDSAALLCAETQLLKELKGKHFVKVYANSSFPVEGDAWDIVDFVPGISVEQTAGKWPELLTPAVRLSVLLAACECQTEVTNLSSPAYLVDLKTDAFKVQPDGQIKLIDAASEKIDQQFGNEAPRIALELARLAVNLFRRTRKYSDPDVDNAIDFYLNPERLDNAKKFGLTESQKTTVISVFSECDFPLGLEEVLSGFLNEVRAGNLKPNQTALNCANRILPIVNRMGTEQLVSMRKEVVLTDAETVFLKDLKALVDFEKQYGLGKGKGGEIRLLVFLIRSFGGLPADSQIKDATMKIIISQLGETGKKLKNHQKSDAEILKWWLGEIFSLKD